MTKSAKLKTADISGVEKEEKNNANAQTIKNCRTMKYSAARTQTSIFSNLWAMYRSARKTPSAMKNVLTTSVPVSPKNFPTMNSQRRTGRESTVYKVRLSISFETRAMPMKIAMTTD